MCMLLEITIVFKKLKMFLFLFFGCFLCVHRVPLSRTILFKFVRFCFVFLFFLGFYYCDGCRRKYRNMGSLIRHKRYECGLEPQFRCDICLKSFTRNTTLRDHRVNIHNIDSALSLN